MYSIEYTNRFRKDLKRCVKRGLDINKILAAVKLLEQSGSLPANNLLTLLFMQTGTHSDLF